MNETEELTVLSINMEDESQAYKLLRGEAIGKIQHKNIWYEIRMNEVGSQAVAALQSGICTCPLADVMAGQHREGCSKQ